MNIFIQIFYQPFLNLLVGIYYFLHFILGSGADMGIAVIIFTVAIRIILMPLTISGDRSEAERYRLSGEVEELKKKFSADPVARDAHVKNLLKANRKIVFVSGLNLAIQTIVALMLWRIFASGLLGEDFHLLYDFVPQPKEAFNLTFLGKYDLTHPNATFNALQSIVILIFEIEVSLFSLFPITRKEMILAQFTLPVGSYIIFSQLPAGKKLFIITTLLFSIVYISIRQIKYWWYRLGRAMDKKTEVVADLPPQSI
ncbi:MAG: YidC/Oxa1 family membrane protein insertase [Patescibacteria group bacterium]